MEVVINTRYGGFGLSHKAVMRYAELKGLKLYPWVHDIYRKVYGGKASVDNPQCLVLYTTVPQEEYEEVLEKDKLKPVAPGRFTQSNELHFSPTDIQRNDKALIQIIREMGAEANAQCSELTIIDIPDGVEWEIEEYDGMEWVAEKHRTWGQ